MLIGDSPEWYRYRRHHAWDSGQAPSHEDVLFGDSPEWYRCHRHHAWDSGQAPSHEVLLFGDCLNGTGARGTMLVTADKLRHRKMCSLVIRHGTGADGHHAWDNGQAPSEKDVLLGDSPG